MIYREFTIQPCYLKGYMYSHENYDGAPDADNSIYNRVGSCMTIEECKTEIDEWHIENTPVTLTLSFAELQAVQFAIAIADVKASSRELKTASRKVDQVMVDIQKDIEFERQYTVND
jgi:hypothetical protein